MANIIKKIVKNKPVQLISAPRDQETSPISRSGAYQPLGLLSIASYLLSNEICTSVEIFDGEFNNVSEIEPHISDGIVGISCTTPSYRNALRIAKIAKEHNAIVVLGGPHATAVGKIILKKRNEIDFIVRGDGEEGFAKLVMGCPPEEIPNLLYRKDGKVIENPLKDVSFISLPFLRRELLPLEPYIDRYSKQDSSIARRRPAAIYSQKGCMWRYQSSGCIFCGRLDKGWRGRPPDDVWKEISKLIRYGGVNYIWDVSDSFTSSHEWVSRFASARPSNLDIKFFLYAKSNEINQEITELLATIGCDEVFIGVESGDNELLQQANKGITVEDNLRAAHLLQSFGIRMFPCFVLGLPGETSDTLEKTFNHAEQISDICEISTISASVLVPLPGSRSFSKLKHHLGKKFPFAETDIFNMEELGRLWVDTFCDASWENIHTAIDKILGLSTRVSSFFNFNQNLSTKQSMAMYGKYKLSYFEGRIN